MDIFFNGSRKFSLTVLTIASVFWLGGCNPTGIDGPVDGGKGKGQTPTMGTVSQADFDADNQKLASAETSLQTVGLKFQVQPGSQTVAWDDSFEKSYLAQNPTAKPADALGPLKDFVKTSADYSKKYTSAFHLTHANGTDEIKTLDNDTLALMKAKADFAKSELKKLNPKQ